MVPDDETKTVTLEEYVLRLYQEGERGSKDLGTLIRVFGKSKIDYYLKKSEFAGSTPKFLTTSDILGETRKFRKE